jgi:hypothetical protein
VDPDRSLGSFFDVEPVLVPIRQLFSCMREGKGLTFGPNTLPILLGDLCTRRRIPSVPRETGPRMDRLQYRIERTMYELDRLRQGGGDRRYGCRWCGWSSGQAQLHP